MINEQPLATKEELIERYYLSVGKGKLVREEYAMNGHRRDRLGRGVRSDRRLGSCWRAGSRRRRTRRRSRPKSVGRFGEGRRGDVPEGTAEMMTPETDQAIQPGPGLAGPQPERRRLLTGAAPTAATSPSPAWPAWPSCPPAPAPAAGPTARRSTRRWPTSWTTPRPRASSRSPGSSTHGPMYSHGFGTLFLAEAYGMTHRPEIREKLRKAVQLIIDTQNNEGGWRYQPVKHDADLSVTICQINALRAARNAGLYVPKDTVDACIQYVKQSQNPDGGFRYMLSGRRQRLPAVGGRRGGAAERRRVRLEGDPRRHRLSPAVHPRNQARQPLQSLLLRPLLRGAGHVDPGRRRLERMVSGDPQRAGPPPVRRRATGPTASATSTGRPWP